MGVEVNAPKSACKIVSFEHTPDMVQDDIEEDYEDSNLDKRGFRVTLTHAPSIEDNLNRYCGIIRSSSIMHLALAGDESIQRRMDDYTNNTIQLALTKLQVLDDGTGVTFSEEDKHQDIYLHYNNCLAEKDAKGRYRSVRATKAIPQSKPCYFEMILIYQRDSTKSAGVGIGLSTKNMPLNALVGTSNDSVGFYSAGYLVHPQDNWTEYGRTFNARSTIGCLVHTKHTETHTELQIEFSLDGVSLGAYEETLQFTKGIDLYPTLSMLEEGTQVVAAFSAYQLRYTANLPTDCVAVDGHPVHDNNNNTSTI